jgi:hypothetical protein
VRIGLLNAAIFVSGKAGLEVVKTMVLNRQDFFIIRQG